MKIKFWDRLILFFGALVTVAAGAILIISGLQIAGAISEALPLWVRIVCLVCGALTLAFGIYLFVFPRKFSARRRDFIVQKTDNGEVRIAVKAVENLVQKCIDTHEEIQVVSMWIHNGRDGVTVDLNVALANNISIPLAVASLQKQIKQYLAASSGIEVKEVRVSVEATQDGMDLPPEIAPAEEEKNEPAEAAAEAPKQQRIPLHQRIFGKPDQPAIVPEPPKEEEPAQEQPAPAQKAEAEEAPATEEEASEANREETAVQEDEAEAPKDEAEEEIPSGEAGEEEEAPLPTSEWKKTVVKEASQEESPSDAPEEEAAAKDADTEGTIHE